MSLLADLALLQVLAVRHVAVVIPDSDAAGQNTLHGCREWCLSLTHSVSQPGFER